MEFVIPQDLHLSDPTTKRSSPTLQRIISSMIRKSGNTVEKVIRV